MIAGLSGMMGGGTGLGGLTTPSNTATAGDVSQQGASIGSGLTGGGAGDRVGLVLNLASGGSRAQSNAGINPISTEIPKTTLVFLLGGLLVAGIVILKLFGR